MSHTPTDPIKSTAAQILALPYPEGMTGNQQRAFERGLEAAAAIVEAMHAHGRRLCEDWKRHFVQPWWFGDEAFKATGWHLIGLPPLVATNRLTPPRPGTDEHKRWSFIHRMPPGPDREERRSKTFPGMASAIAAQWPQHNGEDP